MLSKNCHIPSSHSLTFSSVLYFICLGYFIRTIFSPSAEVIPTIGLGKRYFWKDTLDINNCIFWCILALIYLTEDTVYFQKYLQPFRRRYPNISNKFSFLDSIMHPRKMLTQSKEEIGVSAVSERETSWFTSSGRATTRRPQLKSERWRTQSPRRKHLSYVYLKSWIVTVLITQPKSIIYLRYFETKELLFYDQSPAF